jgi:hypothetical protein
VITQKDKWFSGKFDPEKVEGVLNFYAKQGWVLDRDDVRWYGTGNIAVLQ